MNKAEVRLREENRMVTINVTGYGKPEVNEDIKAKWQALINLVAELFDVPAGLIMKVNRKSIEVLIRSANPDNPYESQDSERLGIGLYCESVLGHDRMLSVTNALLDSNWKDNPDVSFNMISYLGLPLKWSDQVMFGTLCVLDSKERSYNQRQLELMTMFKDIIETDLKLLEANYQLKISANTDALTRLPNRQSLCNVVKNHLESTNHQEIRSSLAMLDLDGFKRINDTYGHRTGDKVLQKFASFLRNQLVPEVFIGRYGGDEFVLLFPETCEEEAETQLQVAREQMGYEPFFKMYELSYTFGITSLINDTDDEMDVLDAADKVMMARKSRRRE